MFYLPNDKFLAPPLLTPLKENLGADTVDVELLRHNVIIQRFTSFVIVMAFLHGWKASNAWTRKNDLFIYIFTVKAEIFGSRRLFSFETWPVIELSIFII